jgi:hypothetical protein
LSYCLRLGLKNPMSMVAFSRTLEMKKKFQKKRRGTNGSIFIGLEIKKGWETEFDKGEISDNEWVDIKEEIEQEEKNRKKEKEQDMKMLNREELQKEAQQFMDNDPLEKQKRELMEFGRKYMAEIEAGIKKYGKEEWCRMGRAKNRAKNLKRLEDLKDKFSNLSSTMVLNLTHEEEMVLHREAVILEAKLEKVDPQERQVLLKDNSRKYDKKMYGEIINIIKLRSNRDLLG